MGSTYTRQNTVTIEVEAENTIHVETQTKQHVGKITFKYTEIEGIDKDINKDNIYTNKHTSTHTTDAWAFFLIWRAK